MKDEKDKKNGYKLSRMWFNYSFENPDKVSPVHSALFLWLCELNNRLGWAEKFAAPASMSMSAIGIRNYRTYKKGFDDLVAWDFVHIIEKSKNQHTANIISLNFAMVKNTKALDSAISKNTKADAKADAKADPIYINNEPLTNKPIVMSDAFSTDYTPIDVFDFLAFELWKQCYDNRVAKNIKPTILQKAKPEVWANEVRLMIETDGRTEAEIIEILNFLKTDDFWAPNIQSPGTLRGKFERLQLEMRKPKKKKAQLSVDLTGQDHHLKPSEV